jgi:hypothetical protein
MNTNTKAAPAAPRRQVRLPLLHALYRSGDKPLDPVAVVAYMEKERRRASSWKWWIRAVLWMRRATDAVFCWLMLGFLLGLVLCGFSALAIPLVSLVTDVPSWYWPALFGSTLGAAVLFGFLLLFSNYCLRYRVAKWRKVPYSKCHERVPQWVRVTVREIKQQSCTARFAVHELWVRDVMVDPVLEVELGDERYYVTVWDLYGNRVALPLMEKI